MLDLKTLKELAQAATPGPWEWGGTECTSQEQALTICKQNLDATARPGTHFCEVFLEDGRRTALVGNGPTSIENAAFIAAANPAVILALIERLEVAEAAPLPAEQPSNPVARIVQAFPLEGGKTVRREDRGNGVHGWLLYDEQGKLVRGLNMFEQGFIDAALSTSKMIYPVDSRIVGQQTKGGGNG